MLSDIINNITTELEELNIFDTVHGMCEIVNDTDKTGDDAQEISYPAEYQKSGELKKISFENELSTCYIRRNGEASISEQDEDFQGCTENIEITIPLKFVGLVSCGEDNAYAPERNVFNIIDKFVKADNIEIAQQMEVESIEVLATGWNTNRYDVFESEFDNIEYNINFKAVLFSIDFEIRVVSDWNCWERLYCYC